MGVNKIQPGRRSGMILLKLACVVIYAILVIDTAWASDDAYITFRSIENFIHHYGPVYNVGERVQAFTHPLWFFVLSTMYYVALRSGVFVQWSLLYYVCIWTSILTSLLAFSILVFFVAQTSKEAVLASLVLLFSKAFVDYSTSGLENPFSHFLLALFVLCYSMFMKGKFKNSSGGIFLLSFIASLAALNRLDLFLLFAPTLLHLLWKNPRAGIMPIILGQIPLILWEGFSLIYYGRFFPNTAYAKLNTGIETSLLVQQGLNYYWNSLRWDPLTLTTIFGGCIALIYHRQKSWWPMITGALFYLLYILYIGGDFMSGRFFSTILFGIVLILSASGIPIGKRTFITLVSSVLVLGIIPLVFRPERSKWGTTEKFVDTNKISDERLVYFPRMGLMAGERVKLPPGCSCAGSNWHYDQDEPMTVKFVRRTGVSGYQAGPNTHVIDAFGLADPFIVYMPLIDRNNWRIGHFEHMIPDGYLESEESGQNQIPNGNLSRFYDLLVIVTKGDLFTRERWIAIIKLNTGQYNEQILDAFRQ